MGNKRRNDLDLDPAELLKSDSEDENYSETATRTTPRKKPRKTTGRKSSQKKSAGRKKSRKKNSYSDDDDDELDSSDEDLEIDAHGFTDQESTPEPEMPSGRPRRQAAVSASKHLHDASDESESSARSSGAEEEDVIDDSEDDVKPNTRGGGGRGGRPKGAAPQPPRSQLVTLKYRGNRITSGYVQSDQNRESVPPPTRRSTRATSAQAQTQPLSRIQTGGKGPPPSSTTTRRTRGASTEPTSATRRSHRLTGEPEFMAELSNSGKHVVLHDPQGRVITDIPEASVETSVEAAKDIDAEGEVDEEELPDAEPSNGHSDQAQLEVRDSQMEPQDDDQKPPMQQNPVSRDDTGHEADDDDDEGPSRRTRGAGRSHQPESVTSSPRALRSTVEPASAEKLRPPSPSSGGRKLRRRNQTKTSRAASDEDEYQAETEEEANSDDSMDSSRHGSKKPTASGSEDSDDDVGTSQRRRGGTTRKRRHGVPEDEEETQELREELNELASDERKRKRPKRAAAQRQLSGNESATVDSIRLRNRKNPVDYRIYRPEMANLVDQEDNQHSGNASPSKRGGKNVPSALFLFNTAGPFGGGYPNNMNNDVDSDSSDDDGLRRPTSLGARGGIPGAAPPGGLLPPVGQTHNQDPIQSTMGRITKNTKNAMADADPLGVPSDITFDSVGGLDDRIQQLKEMVMLPLMYPEMFKAKGVTPPRGVLFHGPPGTGKTLMARAVASSFTGADGKKVTFFMRKGADCLSKWVGEAERQLRLLFEEARNSQPSIIFFDEIDGLAPVRSSKQEQIHASIVSTLLALMDGMDGRGQVVVIGATNRPDAVDPALRRPGRFDREFYFPLPATEARRKILDIHTKGWEPPLTDDFKDQLARQTKGYGGADLRALCTEAALNAMQRTYPQIYKSDSKLKVDPTLVKVTAKDFMVSIKKMVPSSERSSSSGAAPLPENVKPLLERQLESIKECIKNILPEVKRLTPLEEAEYEPEGDEDEGFEREMMMENFESSRIYRPRLLIHGTPGMGQQYLGAAVLHYLEKVHVQSFDLATLMEDATRAPETAIVQLFTEVKRHKPSVIFIPSVDVWYDTLSPSAINTFHGLLRTITPNERIMVFGVSDQEKPNINMIRKFFGYTKRDKFEISRPGQEERRMFFKRVTDLVAKTPRDFPQDTRHRRKRILPPLRPATPPPPKVPTPEEIREQAKKDRQTKNWLKMRLHPIMEALRTKYRRFKRSAHDHQDVERWLKLSHPDRFPRPEEDNDLVVSDIQPDVPERMKAYFDENDELRVEDTHTGDVYYNMDLEIIEERYSNGHYNTPQQFLEDVEKIAHDAGLLNDLDNRRKAKEMVSNVEVFCSDIEADQQLMPLFQDLADREKKRKIEAREKRERKRREKKEREQRGRIGFDSPGPNGSGSSNGRLQLPGHEGHEHYSRGSPSRPIPIMSTPQGRIAQPITTSTAAHVGSATPSSHANSNGQHHSDSGSNSTVHPPDHHHLSGANSSSYMTPPQNATQLVGHLTTANIGIAKLPTGTPSVGPSQHTQPTMQVSTIVNDASTTTSGKRTSDGTAGTNSHPFSIAAYQNSTQNSHPTPSSNGLLPHGTFATPPHPPFTPQQPRPQQGETMIDPPQWGIFGQTIQGDSQLPATQTFPPSSLPSHSSGSQHSQPLSQGFSQSPLAQFHLHQHPNILPAPQPQASQFPLPPPPPPPTSQLPQTQSILDQQSATQRKEELQRPGLGEEATRELLEKLVKLTSGFGVERLEQCFAGAMEVVWRGRGEWERDVVAGEVVREVEGVVREMKEMEEEERREREMEDGEEVEMGGMGMQGGGMRGGEGGSGSFE